MEEYMPEEEEDELLFSSLKTLVDLRESSDIGLWSWTLMQGKKPRRGVRNVTKIALRSFESIYFQKPRKSIFFELNPMESHSGWCILRGIPMNFNYRNSSPSVNASIEVISKIESFRQQLDERKGFCCPLYMGKCQCPPSVRKLLLSLLQWAREGKFGDGEWRDLPSECSYGI
jgi:hypothetical protein